MRTRVFGSTGKEAPVIGQGPGTWRRMTAAGPRTLRGGAVLPFCDEHGIAAVAREPESRGRRPRMRARSPGSLPWHALCVGMERREI
jgi:hypothetical protein